MFAYYEGRCRCIMKEEKSNLNAAGKFIHDLDFIGNDTDKRRAKMIRRLKNVISDIRTGLRKWRKEQS
jgi:hypothetical protein